ncbi:MAG: hypothetical protein COX57_03905 [Alphaproteobacteria bacterium CG_4_10_14_0_2_um_filter_63_37]|nr:MAG: hypothetical protein AUJ55_02205 [Proteobacteria bacterium CG1_02_64_396]PJA25323.1 MAG: hypothetical protein COX57_03905 [Alphaproteobacteria bacterium CG_4_10_14_0_2_um_filter_63_37]
MIRIPRTPNPLLALLLAAAVSGCGGGGGSSSSTGGGTTTTSVGGSVTKGPVGGASVTLYAINADGSRGAAVAGPFSTASDGAWSGTIPSSATPPFEVVATGGSYTDEATGNTVALGTGAELEGLIASLPASGAVTAAITPYTHALALSAKLMAAGGTAVGTAVSSAIASAQTNLGFDPTTVIPPDPLNLPANATAAQKQYAALLGGISQLGQSAGVAGASPIDVAIALSQDMADGKLDGLDASGGQVTLSNGGGTANLPALDTTGMTALNTAATTFAGNHASAYSGVTVPTIGGGFYTPPSGGGTGGGGGTTAPTITSITPSAGPVGTQIAIVGSHFKTTAGGVSVTFGGGVQATPVSLTDGLIGVIVPSGATSGPITIAQLPSGGSVSSVPFTVTGGGGGGGTTTNVYNFGADRDLALYAAAAGNYTVNVASANAATFPALSAGQALTVTVAASGAITVNDTNQNVVYATTSASHPNVAMAAASHLSGPGPNGWELTSWSPSALTLYDSRITLTLHPSGYAKLVINKTLLQQDVVAEAGQLPAGPQGWLQSDAGLTLMAKAAGSYPVYVWSSTSTDLPVGPFTFAMSQVGQQGNVSGGAINITTNEPNPNIPILGNLSDVMAEGFVWVANAWRFAFGFGNGVPSMGFAIQPNGLIVGTYTDALGKQAMFSNDPINQYGTTVPTDFAAIAGTYSATGSGAAVTFIDATGTHTIGGAGTMALTIDASGTVSYALNGGAASVLTWDGNGNYLTRTGPNTYTIEMGDGSQANTIFLNVDLSGGKTTPMWEMRLMTSASGLIYRTP